MILQMIFEALLISLACGLDCLISGFAYGANKIKMPLLSALTIATMGSVVLGLALFLGNVIGKYMPTCLNTAICCSVLFLMGLYRICTWVFKRTYNYKKADVNKDKILSIWESLLLGTVLSLDCFAVGMSAGLSLPSALSYITTIAISFTLSLVFLIFGRYLGNKLAQKTPLNLSWLGGLLLIALAVVKIFI